MKLFLKIALALTAAVSAAVTFAQQVIIPVKSQGCPVPVETLDPPRLPRFKVDSGIGSDEHNWGGPFVIGRAANGDSIRVGYDYNMLTHYVILGDSVVTADISLIFTEVDSAANTAMMSRGITKIKKIDFAAPDFVNTVRSFVAAEPGYHTESYSFGMKPDEQPPIRRTITVDLPDDDTARRNVLQMLNNLWDGNIYYADTVMQIKGNLDNLKDFAQQKAEQMYRSFENVGVHVTPLPAFTIMEPMEAFTDAINFIPVYESPRYITIMMTVSSVYIAGGGRSSSIAYFTFDKSNNQQLTSNDIFDQRRLNDVKRSFVNAVSEQMIAELRMEGDPYTPESAYSPEVILDAFITEEWSPVSEDGEMQYQTDIDAMTLPQMAAITPDGIIFSYPGEIFTAFGETGFYTQLVRWNEIAQFLKPDIRKSIFLSIRM